VETPPRCPKCETELEETRSFWGGYIWKCVNCGFKKETEIVTIKRMNGLKKSQDENGKRNTIVLFYNNGHGYGVLIYTIFGKII